MFETINGKSSSHFNQTASGIALPVPTGLPPTGQTISYVDGDDGDHEAGYKPPGDRFTDNGNGTVTDNATGLMWVKDGTGAGCNNGTALGWEDAIAFANGQGSLTFAGYDDWRIPNCLELISIVDFELFNPAINPIFINTVSGSYYSSTTAISDTGKAAHISFMAGFLSFGAKGTTYNIRPCRSGKV